MIRRLFRRIRATTRLHPSVDEIMMRVGEDGQQRAYRHVRFDFDTEHRIEATWEVERDRE